MNAFLEFAERQTPAPVKAQWRAAEKRQAKAAEKALAERDSLFSYWKLWRRERLEALLASPHGAAARKLVDFLQTLTLADEMRLVEHVRTNGWADADPGTRLEVLSLIGSSLIALRERNSLLPFDDPLPEDPDSAFLILRELLQWA
jgi:hypothetical protein